MVSVDSQDDTTKFPPGSVGSICKRGLPMASAIGLRGSASRSPLSSALQGGASERGSTILNALLGVQIPIVIKELHSIVTAGRQGLGRWRKVGAEHLHLLRLRVTKVRTKPIDNLT